LNPTEPSANDELARLLAAPAHDSGSASVMPELTWPCLLMRIGARWCGVRVEAVREVVAPEAITRVPAQPRHVLGVTLVHGRLVPAIDLGPLMPGMSMQLERPGRRLAVVSHEELEIGLLADEARGVVYLPAITEGYHNAERPLFIIGEVRWKDELVCLLDTALLVQAAMGAG
jgi:chemotaxis signal transduction protein